MGLQPFCMWFGDTFDDAAPSYWGRASTLALAPTALHSNGAWGGLAEALLYFTSQGTPADVAALPHAQLYQQRALGFVRSGWAIGDEGGEGQSFVAFKGGDNKWNHGHLDLGSFVLDLNATRFVME